MKCTVLKQASRPECPHYAVFMMVSYFCLTAASMHKLCDCHAFGSWMAYRFYALKMYLRDTNAMPISQTGLQKRHEEIPATQCYAISMSSVIM